MRTAKGVQQPDGTYILKYENIKAMTPTPTLQEIEKAAKSHAYEWQPEKRISFITGAKSLLPLIAERDAEIERLKGLLKQSECKYVSLLIKTSANNL